jgi:hypothetical protein
MALTGQLLSIVVARGSQKKGVYSPNIETLREAQLNCSILLADREMETLRAPSTPQIVCNGPIPEQTNFVRLMQLCLTVEPSPLSGILAFMSESKTKREATIHGIVPEPVSPSARGGDKIPAPPSRSPMRPTV